METLIVSAAQPLRSDSVLDPSYDCGADDCVFLDRGNNVDVSPQIVLVPYEDCAYTDIEYLFDFRVFSPRNCTRQENLVLVIAISTYIAAFGYGTAIVFDFPHDEPPGPFQLLSPERRIHLTISRLTWQYRDLGTEFNVTCLRENCSGLYYRLPHTGRYVFVGADALPLGEIHEATFANPIPLVQFNPARFFDPESKSQVRAEPLRWGSSSSFGSWNWTQKPSGQSCSLLMDSFIQHTIRSNLVIHRPFHIVHQSALFYLFSRGAVTELNDSAVARNASQLGGLGNVRLKGSKEYSRIIIRVPFGTLMATLVCCCALVVIAVLIVAFPSRTVEYYSPEVTTAEQYLMIRSDKYANSLHEKTLLFPASGEALPMDDFEVIRVTLANREDPTETLSV